jgi:hypothetical protein
MASRRSTLIILCIALAGCGPTVRRARPTCAGTWAVTVSNGSSQTVEVYVGGGNTGEQSLGSLGPGSSGTFDLPSGGNPAVRYSGTQTYDASNVRMRRFCR